MTRAEFVARTQECRRCTESRLCYYHAAMVPLVMSAEPDTFWALTLSEQPDWRIS